MIPPAFKPRMFTAFGKFSKIKLAIRPEILSIGNETNENQMSRHLFFYSCVFVPESLLGYKKRFIDQTCLSQGNLLEVHGIETVTEPLTHLLPSA